MHAPCSTLRSSSPEKAQADNPDAAQSGADLRDRLQYKELSRNPERSVAYGLDLWLRFFQVRPRASYDPLLRRFEIRISGSPALAGALALQIMLALAGSAGIAICASCGKTFPPSRRPNPNRKSYCKSCGIKAAWRDAQARRRQSQRRVKL